MGSKTAARDGGDAGRCAVVPGTEQPFGGDARATRRSRAKAERIGYPLVVKAVAGGGGKGMRVVERPTRWLARSARRDPKPASAFGDTAVYLERRLQRPRHIEIQLLGDQHGTVVPFVERECSIQRRHQKVVEESPSLAVDAGPAPADGAARPPRWRGRSATPTPARSSSCSTRTARSTSSR